MRSASYCGLLWSLLCGPLAAAEPRFAAVWADGSRTSGDDVRDWGEPRSNPRLNDRPLFDAKNPARSLINRQVVGAAPPNAFVELVGGDCLPGRVVGYDLGQQSPDGVLPPHLIVEPTDAVDLEGQPSSRVVRVDLGYVRRIVWHSGGAPLAAGMISTIDGRRFAVRALRWSQASLGVLSADGPLTLNLDELVECHLPPADAWPVALRQLAVLSPDLHARWQRLETAGGSRLTTSPPRFEARHVHGNEPSKWLHLLQPAWSLDLLMVKHLAVRRRDFFSPLEIPLTCFEPRTARRHDALAGGWARWQVDRNVQGGPLRTAGRDFGWGLGTHAQQEIEFALPRCARAFRASVGLDQLAGTGGCARARVAIDGQQVYESELLIGSSKVLDTGRLVIGQHPARLQLISDAALGQGPPGADPLDIRDLVDWLEPLVELDPHAVRGEIDEQLPAAVPALADWTVDTLASGSWRVDTEFDTADHAAPVFRTLLALDAPLTLTRRLTVAAEHPTMALHLARPARSSRQSQFEVWIDGRRISRASIPAIDAQGHGQPILLSLGEHAGREIELSIRLDPAGKPARIDWRGATLGQPAASVPDR